MAGESYGGILITSLAAAIAESDLGFNLGGVLHGNGAVGHFCGCLGRDCSNRWPPGFCTGDVPHDTRHHVDFFHRAALTTDSVKANVDRACSDLQAPSAECSKAKLAD